MVIIYSSEGACVPSLSLSSKGSQDTEQTTSYVQSSLILYFVTSKSLGVFYSLGCTNVSYLSSKGFLIHVYWADYFLLCPFWPLTSCPLFYKGEHKNALIHTIWRSKFAQTTSPKTRVGQQKGFKVAIRNYVEKFFKNPPNNHIGTEFKSHT